MDLLGELLRLGRVRGTVGARIDAGDDWGWWAADAGRAAFHAVTDGCAWISLPDGEVVQLLPGDVLLLPRGSAHALGSDPAAVRRTTTDRFDGYRDVEPGVVAIGTGPTRTQVLCAHYEHDATAVLPVLRELPEVIQVSARDAPTLDDTIRLLSRELRTPQLGTDVLLDHLVDVLLIQVLRAWISQAPEAVPVPWLRSLRDAVVRDALLALHAEPSRAWSVELLAAAVAVSPATLTRRFSNAISMTPAAYLTELRLARAAHELRETAAPLSEVAGLAGYTSVHAFSRAFRRKWGVAPGRFRASAGVPA